MKRKGSSKPAEAEQPSTRGRGRGRGRSSPSSAPSPSHTLNEGPSSPIGAPVEPLSPYNPFSEHTSQPQFEEPEQPQPSTQNVAENAQPPPEVVESEGDEGDESEEEGEEVEEGKETIFEEKFEEILADGKIKIHTEITKFRSIWWKHFTPFRCEITKFIKGRCNYCGRTIFADGKKYGPSGLKKHMDSCKRKPQNMKSDQTRLNFEPATGALTPWKFDQEYVMEGILRWIVVTEMPFSTVDHPEFKEMFRRACPMLKLNCRKTITQKIYKMYLDDKKQMKAFIKENSQRVCLTTDTWTSIKRENYMVLTAHFIDNNWNLKKRILSFCLITGHSGEHIARDLQTCLTDWGIQKIFTITVDNASANETGIDTLITRLKIQGGDSVVLDGQFVQVRCIAHILNLVVQDGLKLTGDGGVVDRFRAAIKYVKASNVRYKMFKERVKAERIQSKKLLSLDVPTRWNSTYTMLSAALALQKAFYAYEIYDPYYKSELCGNIPQLADWDMAKIFVEFLKPFKKLTKTVSGTSYTTSHLMVREINDIDELLDDWVKIDNNEDGFVPKLKEMAFKMKEKYDKYWGITDKMNHMFYYAAIVDPRCKYEYIKIMVTDKSLQMTIWNGFEALFNEYKRMYDVRPASTRCPIPKHVTPGEKRLNKKHLLFLRSAAQNDMQLKSEFDKYFEDGVEPFVEGQGFDILSWWKVNSGRYPIISKMARDILAIPVSTVASESAFSTGGRILDRFRSSLSPKIVEALICAQDWLRDDKLPPIDIEECILDMEILDEEFEKFGLGKD